MTAKQNLKTYEITRILRPSKQNSSNSHYNVFLKLDKNITFSGFTNCEPQENDLIECILYPDSKSKSDIFYGKNVNLKLPENPIKQKQRVIRIL
jgi:hypothetical protein